MILQLDEVKEYLRLEKDYFEEDGFLHLLIKASENYLYNATGKHFDSSNELAKLFCMVLITDWYENREIMGKASEKVRYTIESMIIQLQFCD